MSYREAPAARYFFEGTRGMVDLAAIVEIWEKTLHGAPGWSVRYAGNPGEESRFTPAMGAALFEALQAYRKENR